MSNAVVETRSGKVRGSEQGSVTVWKGIPFALPPTGSRRFLPPQPPEPWVGIRNATTFGPMAPQLIMEGLPISPSTVQLPPMSEDCLYLNVWSPGADQEKRPVIVWIHGGAFINGSGADPWYDGTSFAANHNIVVATLNYRLGILGFLYLKELAGQDAAYTGNCGLLDQIAGLQWVRDNIAAFGGDPNNVTVMGESAGAMSIGALLAMPAAKGLFRRAVLQSGAGSSVTKPPRATAVARALLDKLGLQPSQVAALAEVPVETLLKIQPELAREFGGVRAYCPIIDGETLPQHPFTMLAQGSASDIAILTGSNRDEWRLFALMGETATPNEDLLKRIFGDAAQQALARYTEARADKSPEGAWIDIMGDWVFRVPQLCMAEIQVKQGAPVWMYRFDWESPVFGGRLGAAHGIEIPFVWNTLNTPIAQRFTGDSPDRQPLADLMHAAWAAFIRDGNPSIAGLPTWPRYDLERRATMIFRDVPRVVDDPQGQLRSLWPAVLT